MYTRKGVTVSVRVSPCVHVRLCEDKNTVIGNWGENQRTIKATSDGRLLQEFVNLKSGDPEEILTWTKRCGPLHYPPRRRGPDDNFLRGYVLGIQSDGREFPKFTLERWRMDQAGIRAMWEMESGLRGKDWGYSPDAITHHLMWPLEVVSVKGGSVVDVQVGDMYKFLVMHLDVVGDRLRVCENPECKKSKWFVTHHGRQKLCSTACLGWSRRQAQKRYWHSDKGKQRRKQKA